MSDESRANEELEAQGGVPAAEPQTDAEHWAAAFAALEEPPAAGAAGDEAGPDAGAAATVQPGAEGAAPADGAAAGGDAGVDAGDAGGHVPADGAAGGDGELGAGVDVEAVVTERLEAIEQTAIASVVESLLNRQNAQGQKTIRQTNGKLGATINDPDIYRVDNETGVPTFYNPDTGRPFTGDDPRAQAEAWCNRYNNQLRSVFDDMVVAEKGKLEQTAAPELDLIRFTPVYEKLDATRQKMFDALIEGHEVYDANQNHVGYSVDLNATLERVNRQVAALQADRAPEAPPQPQTPALDMPTSGSQGSGAGREIRSVADGLEALQDAELAKLKEGKR